MIDGISIHRTLFLSPNVRHINNRRPDLFFASLFFYPSTSHYITKVVKDFRPDIINVHFPDCQIPFVLSLRRRYRFKLVVSLHGHEILRWLEVNGPSETISPALTRDKGLRRLRTILDQADEVTACSQYLLERAVALEGSVAHKCHVIQNGVDYKLLTQERPFIQQRPFVFACGRLTRTKGFDLLLEAFARIATGNSDVDLIIAGDGECRTKLEAQADSLGITPRVKFQGWVEPRRVAQFLSGCFFVVVPSRQETFGITALEAVATGTPLVATRVGGMPEFLNAKSWSSPVLLVDASADQIAEGLSRMLDGLSTQHSNHRETRHLVPFEYTWEHVAHKYLAIYEGDARCRSS
jgi:glycogen(starch) synthase